MKLYLEIIKLLINKYIKRYGTGKAIKILCEHMGITYIKLAQMLATQNYGDLFKEEDRQLLSSICDNCNPIPFEDIQEILRAEYNEELNNLFTTIDREPIGSASVSQVHKAILKNGEMVAIKIKRKDITDNLYKDIEQMRSIVNRFGKLVNFNNLIGKDRALDLYIKWIYDEIDFEHEKENIKLYQSFANSVNGKVPNTKNIKIPKLYENLCTKNIIVMEYIDCKTLNKMELNAENTEKIASAINSYIKLSFEALLHNEMVVFHGDPHSGNIYIDNNGDIGFLDMGLLFELSKTDVKIVQQFFINAYLGDYDKLLELLMPYAKISAIEKEQFKEDIKSYCHEVKTKDITCYFTDVINICLKYEFLPPDFLFCMAKSLICLNGINKFSNNQTKAIELLQEQVANFFIARSYNDIKKLIIDNGSAIPHVLKSIYNFGIVNGLTNELPTIQKVDNDLKTTLLNFKEMLKLLDNSRLASKEIKKPKQKNVS
ncbi:MAG: AarF/ABC1/UbiB kinase family protein [Bacilli bacterium]|nr:AarF/ABC1/UbiB kinase family protein [Bacilli bacterium]